MKLPPPFSWLWSAWKAFGNVLGKIMSKIILTILWIVGFGIYAIAQKIIGLVVKPVRAPGTFWTDVPPAAPDHLHHQF